jgi:hypothetical protein
MTENGHGWRLTELVNSSGDATEIQGGCSESGADGKAMGGLPAGCSE